MRVSHFSWIWAFLATCSSATAASANSLAPDEAVVRQMQTELQRSMQQLKTPNRGAPYFLGYWVVDYEQLHLRAMLGTLVSDQRDAGRRVRVELRVGRPSLDNSNYVSAEGAFDAGSGTLTSAPVRGERGLRRALWLASDRAYREAWKVFEQKQAERQSEVQVETRPPDFSTEAVPSVRIQAAAPRVSRPELAKWIRDASAEFLAFPEVYESEVSAEAWRMVKYFVSSEGVQSFAPQTIVRFGIRCVTQATDGMPLQHDGAWFGVDHGASLGDEARRLAAELTELREAELIQDYSGPVLFEGVAAAQITQELLATSFSGTPGQENQDGPLARRLGKRVLPSDVHVYDDPTLNRLGSMSLVGHYPFDDDAVPPSRVHLVEGGRLRRLLMSRTPRKGQASSNGHGRSGLSGWTVGAVGNLVLETTRGRSKAALQRALLKAVKEEGAPFGLIIKRLDRRSFATSGVMPPQAQRAYKLYPDGREVLVRGASLGEMSVRDLRDLLDVGRTLSAFSYAVVWPSGLWSPSSVVAPPLLFEEVEVIRPKGAHARPPAFPRPPPSAP